MHVQRYISRRQALGVMGAGIASLALPKFGLLAHVEPALAASGSKLTPELTEGPYWVNTMLHRSDVRANTGSATTLPGAVQPGVPLAPRDQGARCKQKLFTPGRGRCRHLACECPRAVLRRERAAGRWWSNRPEHKWGELPSRAIRSPEKTLASIGRRQRVR